MTHHIAKITEIVGSSEKGWEEAAQVALDEAKKTIREITGIEVVDMTATVDPNTGSITKYKNYNKNSIWCRTLELNRDKFFIQFPIESYSLTNIFQTSGTNIITSYFSVR